MGVILSISYNISDSNSRKCRTRCISKKTRQYKIALKDIIVFLQTVEENPGKYNFPSFSSAVKNESDAKGFEIPNDNRFYNLAEKYYEEKFQRYPDLLTTSNVSDVMGYSREKVAQWINNEKFIAIRKNGFLIPKSTFLTYISGREFILQPSKSSKHQSQLNDIVQIYK